MQAPIEPAIFFEWASIKMGVVKFQRGGVVLKSLVCAGLWLC